MNTKYIYALGTILSVICATDTFAAIRVGNLSRSYADAYNTVNTINARATEPATATTNDLPVRVADADMASRFARGDAPVATLESCARVYPDGEFMWNTPTVGSHAGGDMTCVAVVEMRAINSGLGGEDMVLARAYLAAGDTVKCNISDFPESSYTVNAGTIEFPADAEPTMDDVIRVMNDEQKKNAGIKIAAGTVIGGLMGNIAGQNEVGRDGLMGTGKGKMQGTAIGALSGAALVATSTYSGKIAGDTILSSGVNAAAGSAIGNMMGGANTVLRVEKCTLPDGRSTTCLWGVLQTGDPISLSNSNDPTVYYNISTGDIVRCNSDSTQCNPASLINILIDGYDDMDTAYEEQFEKIKNDPNMQYSLDNNKRMSPGFSGNADGMWARVTRASTPGREIMAMVSDVENKTFGMSPADWSKWRRNHPDAQIWGRDNKGNPYTLGEEKNADNYSLTNFNPSKESANNSGLLDYGNRARMKNTMIGAGAGAGLGALAGYTGAQNEVEDRWVTEVRQYQDSLQKIYCVTGKRFLSHYNDSVFIPPLDQ